MTIASDLFRTVTVKINDISQQLPYIVVNQADDNGKIIRFVPMDHGQKVTGFTGARLYYPPRSDNQYGDYVTGVESDGAWDFTIPVGALSVGRVGCNLSFIDGNGETYSRNVVFLVEPAVSGVFDPEDGQQTRIDKIIGTVQDTADTAIGSINKTASDAVDSIGKAEASINESVTVARGSADAAANSEQQAAASASAAQTSERNAANSAMQASQSATSANQSETNAAESERNAASSAEQAANVVASVSGSVSQAEDAARSASQSATAAAGSASAAGGNAQAAAQSASDASSSASAAKTSETNAVSSASAAKISETNAADSATAAQNAVDGFGLEVGTTTTGEPGTDAAVEIQKTGTKYTANFTIPRGDIGPAGVNENVPLGTASGMVAQATDAYPALPRKVQVHGRTIENLCPAFNHVNNGVTFSTDDDGYISIKGTSTNAIYEQRPIDNLPQNTKVCIYVDSNFKAKGITNIYAQSSGWALYAKSNKVNSSTTLSATSGNLVISIGSGVTVDTKIRVMLVASETEPDANLFVPSGVHTVEPEKLVAYGKSEQENKSEVNLPSDISLADGDTLAIDRDGTTRILHAEGEPTVLDNVTLPELPAPTFNVYTTGGYVPPTVDVTYERDVNLALDHEIPHDVTLVGNGTKSSPLGVGDLSSRYTPTTTTTALDTRVTALEMIDGTFINPISKSGDDADADSIARGKIYRVDRRWKNIPESFIGGYLFYGFSASAHFQLLFGYTDNGGEEAVYTRQGWSSIGGRQWHRLVKESEYQALEARVQALEAKLSN